MAIIRRPQLHNGFTGSVSKSSSNVVPVPKYHGQTASATAVNHIGQTTMHMAGTKKLGPKI